MSVVPLAPSLVVTYPSTTAPSSALLLACSHALRARSPSTVPPYRPSGPVLDPVTQVFTTKLVLDSNGYGRDEVYAEWQAFKQLVVDICCETFCCMVLLRLVAEYCEALFAIMMDDVVLSPRRGQQYGRLAAQGIMSPSETLSSPVELSTRVGMFPRRVAVASNRFELVANVSGQEHPV
jgi:hypothetical protein